MLAVIDDHCLGIFITGCKKWYLNSFIPSHSIAGYLYKEKLPLVTYLVTVKYISYRKKYDECLILSLYLIFKTIKVGSVVSSKIRCWWWFFFLNVSGIWNISIHFHFYSYWCPNCHFLPSGSLFKLAPECLCLILTAFDSFLSFWYDEIFQAHHVHLLPRPGIAHCPKEPWILLAGNMFRGLNRDTRVFIATFFCKDKMHQEFISVIPVQLQNCKTFRIIDPLPLTSFSQTKISVPKKFSNSKITSYFLIW